MGAGDSFCGGYLTRLHELGVATRDAAAGVDLDTWRDILDFAGRTVDEPDLVLPHPRAAERAFVLVPWAMLSPDDRLGGPDGPRVADLAAGVDQTGVAVAEDLRIEL